MSNYTAQLGGKVNIAKHCPNNPAPDCYSLSSNGEKAPGAKGNQFNEREINGFYGFLYNIFPKINYNAAVRKNDINNTNAHDIDINNANVLGAGTFGIAIAYEDLVIKVLKSGCNFAFLPKGGKVYDTICGYEEHDGYAAFRDTIDEIKIMDNIFMNKYKIYDLSVVPNSINKIYGYITFNTHILDALWEINPNLFDNQTYYGDVSNFPISNIPDLFGSNIKDIYHLFWLSRFDELDPDTPAYPNFELGYVSYVLMEKATADLFNYYIDNMRVIPIEHCIKLLTDMHEALRYFKSKNLIHRDIKANNLVIKGQKAPLLPQYQLIDFGFIQIVPYDTSENVSIKTLIAIYNVTLSEQFVLINKKFYQHYAYDYFCVLLALFQIMEFTDWKGNFDNPRGQSINIKNLSPQELHIYFLAHINNNFHYESQDNIQKLIDIVMLMFAYVTIVKEKILIALNIKGNINNYLELTQNADTYIGDNSDTERISIPLGKAGTEMKLSINQILRELDRYLVNEK